MFEKMKMFAAKAWMTLTTPERKGFLKRVHVTRHGHKIRKMVVYYPQGDAMPEYEVFA